MSIIENIVAIFHRSHKFAHQVVTWFRFPLLNDFRDIHVIIKGRIHDIFSDVFRPVGPGDHSITPSLQTFVITFRSTEHLTNQSHRQWFGDIGDNVARTFGYHRIYKLSDHCCHMIFIGEHLAGSESPGHNASLTSVFRIISINHRWLRSSIGARPIDGIAKKCLLSFCPPNIFQLGQHP